MTESEVLEVRIGDEHITPEQIMDVNIGTYGPGDYVLPTGQKLEAQLLSNNSIRIFDGAMVYCGVRDVIAANNYHDVTIENGQQGMNRNDIIVRHFEKNEETQFGGAEFQVIKGTATSGDAADPEITDTDLRAGALTHDMKIYRARLEGLNVVAVEPLFETLPSIPELNGKMPVIQSGTGTLTYANYAVCTARVTFPEPFDEVPDITITPIVPSEGSWNSTRNSITNSTYMIAGKTKEYFDVRSFSIQDDYTETLTIQFDWTAKL